MKSKSIKGKSTGEIKSALEGSIADGFKPTLAIIFQSVSHDISAVTKVFDDLGIAVYGSTTNGEMIDDQLTEKSIVALLLDLKKDYFKIYFEEYELDSPIKATRKIATDTLNYFENPAYLIAGSHMGIDAEQLLHGFTEVIGPQIEVYGGMAGDDFTFKDQFVFTNRKKSNHGVVAVALDANKIKIRGRAICGWKPMGTEKTVTKSEGNHVYTIDYIPVLEITKRYSGLQNLTLENAQIAMEIATTFPFQLQREKGAPVMRPGLVVDWNDGSFYCSGTVPQGSKVRFSLPPDFDIIDEVIENCEQLKKEEMPEADALIVYSCGGRLMTFGPLMSKEVEGVYQVWKVPMVGMLSHAELARATEGSLEMHNLTTCFVALKEI